MKKIDIHTGKETKDMSRYKRSIASNLVMEYVLQHIDFPLPHEHWIIIDKAFAYEWNDKLGIGGYFYWDEIAKAVYASLKQQKLLITYERTEKIVNLILTYIEEKGGFLT